MNLPLQVVSPLIPFRTPEPLHTIDQMAKLLNGENMPIDLPSLSTRLSSQMATDWRAEFWCILACELGEKGVEMALYGSGVENWNNWALPVGFLAGLSYAMVHIRAHAKAHGIQARWSEALKQALTAESGCVLAATTTEWAAGNIANPETPFDPQALGYSAVALPVAFVIGLAAMSTMALVRKDVFGRVVVEKDELPDELEALRSDLENADLTLFNPRGSGTISIVGRDSTFKIGRKAVPVHLREQFDPELHRLAVLRHALARKSRHAVEPLLKFFTHVVPNGRSVDNPYECGGHHHAHLSHSSGDHAHACSHGGHDHGHSHEEHTHDHGHEALTPAPAPVHSHSHGHGPCKHHH